MIVICPLKVGSVNDLTEDVYPSRKDITFVPFNKLYLQNRVNLSYATDYGLGE